MTEVGGVGGTDHTEIATEVGVGGIDSVRSGWN